MHTHRCVCLSRSSSGACKGCPCCEQSASCKVRYKSGLGPPHGYKLWAGWRNWLKRRYASHTWDRRLNVASPCNAARPSHRYPLHLSLSRCCSESSLPCAIGRCLYPVRAHLASQYKFTVSSTFTLPWYCQTSCESQCCHQGVPKSQERSQILSGKLVSCA